MSEPSAGDEIGRRLERLLWISQVRDVTEAHQRWRQYTSGELAGLVSERDPALGRAGERPIIDIIAELRTGRADRSESVIRVMTALATALSVAQTYFDPLADPTSEELRLLKSALSDLGVEEARACRTVLDDTATSRTLAVLLDVLREQPQMSVV